MGFLRRAWWQFVRLGFRLLYNELAWSYDLVSWFASLGAWRAWQRAALPYVQGEQVLEIAHGPGHMLLALQARGYVVTGLDLSPAMGRLAARRLRAHGVSPAPLVRGRAQVLPFPAKQFDTLLSTFPTPFIAEGATMREAHRVLRPGGRFLIVPEGHLSRRGPLRHFVNWLYLITGQRAEAFEVDEEDYWPSESPHWHQFRQQMGITGFTLEIAHLQLTDSGVTVVIATKSEI